MGDTRRQPSQMYEGLFAAHCLKKTSFVDMGNKTDFW
jgi:hypothetical protein